MQRYVFIKFKANTDEVTTKTCVATETEVLTKVDVVTQSVLKEEKGRSRDKSNSSKRKLSRHLNTKRKCLMSQPRDDLSHQRLNMSRQAILCRDIIGNFPAGQFSILP